MSSADEPLVLQALGHVAVGDAPGEALDDRGLADARLADQHRVVLGAPAEHLDDAADLVVAADDRIDLAVAGAVGEVLAVLLERGELLLGVLAGDAVAAAHLLQRLQQLLAADAEALVHRQQQVLDGEVVVLQVLAVGLGVLEDVGELAVHPRLVAAVGLGQLGDGLVGLVAHHQRREAEGLHERRGERVVLAGQGDQHVIGRELRVAVGLGLVDGRGHRLLGLDGPLLRVERHERQSTASAENLIRVVSSLCPWLRSDSRRQAAPAYSVARTLSHDLSTVGEVTRPGDRRFSLQLTWRDGRAVPVGDRSRSGPRGHAARPDCNSSSTPLGLDVRFMSVSADLRLALPGVALDRASTGRGGARPADGCRRDRPRADLRGIGRLVPRGQHARRRRPCARVAPGRCCTIDGPVHVARWVPTVDDALQLELADLHPRCRRRAASTTSRRASRRRRRDRPAPAERAGLAAQAARHRAAAPSTGPRRRRSGRSPRSPAACSTAATTSRPSARCSARWRHELDRASGLPVVAAQLRLHLPEASTIRGCSRSSWSTSTTRHGGARRPTSPPHTPLAIDLAGRPEHLARLRERGRRAALRSLAEHVPELASARRRPRHRRRRWSARRGRGVPHPRARPPSTLDMRLLGPEQLVRARTGVRAAATPRRRRRRRGRFAAERARAVERHRRRHADRRRAARAGHRGRQLAAPRQRRWVRLDARQVRSTLGAPPASTATTTPSSTSPALIRLAAEAASRPGRRATASASTARAGSPTCSPGCPTSSWSRRSSPARFTGELRHYQRRGLSWMGFLARLGLGGCLADDMGLGKTATTLAHLADTTGAAPRRVPAQRRAQLVRRGGPVHAHSCRSSIHHGNERARGDDVGRPARAGRRRRHHVRAAGARHRDAGRGATGARSCSTRRRR